MNTEWYNKCENLYGFKSSVISLILILFLTFFRFCLKQPNIIGSPIRMKDIMSTNKNPKVEEN